MCSPELQQLNSVMQNMQEKKRNNPSSKCSMPALPILSYVYRDHLPVETDLFKDIKTSLKDTTINFYNRYSLTEPKSEAFNTANGLWCEYIYGATSWNKLAEINRNTRSGYYYVYVKLPKNTGPRHIWTNLLDSSVKNVIDSFNKDSTNQLISNSGHTGFILFSSNADSMIFKYKKEKLVKLNVLDIVTENIHNLNPRSIQIMDGMFNLLRHSAMPSENLVAFLSVKSTLRPDRRYQFVHEGDSAKATLMFVAARGADPGLAQVSVTKYLQNRVFAVSFGGVKNVDLRMANIAMSACVSSPLMDPVWAVDKLYDCQSIDNASSSISEIINFSTSSQ